MPPQQSISVNSANSLLKRFLRKQFISIWLTFNLSEKTSQTDLNGKILPEINERGENETEMLFLDTGLKHLMPEKAYEKLCMTALNCSSDDLQGTFTGFFDAYTCERGHTVYKPILELGKRNPYKVMKTARCSASRRLKIIKYLDIASNRKSYLLHLVFTLPKKLSKKLFSLKDGKLLFHQCNKEWFCVLNNFLKNKVRLETKSRLKFGKEWKIGTWSNEHLWSSEKPFDPHFHNHTCMPNYLINTKTHKIIRFRPSFSDEELKKLKSLWNKHVAEFFERDEEELNLYVSYRKEKHTILHTLKYCTRSHLLDISEFYFQEENAYISDQSFESQLRSFRNFVQKGTLENRTYTYGFIHNTKKLMTYHNVYELYRLDKSIPCERCGHDIVSKKVVKGFPKNKNLVVYQAIKSRYRKIDEISHQEFELLTSKCSKEHNLFSHPGGNQGLNPSYKF